MTRLGWLLIAILCIEILCYYGGKKFKLISKLMALLSVGLILAGLVIASQFVNYHNFLAVLLLVALWWTGLMIIVYFLTSIKKDRMSKPQGIYGQAEPRVAIIISVHDEDYEVVERAVAAVKNLYYEDKHRLSYYLVDSSERMELKELATDMKMVYCQKSHNFLADYQQFQGEYLLLLAADKVVQNNFLYRTLGFFDNPKLAALQVAFTHYNDYVLQYYPFAAYSPASQQRRDKFGAAMITGECTILRRKALDSLRVKRPISEIIELAPYLQIQGWLIRYARESLANGLAPENMPALLQRFRYNMRLNRLGRKIVTLRLGFWKQLLHLEWFTYVTFSWRKLLLWVCPIIYFWLNKQAFVQVHNLFLAAAVPGGVAIILSLKLQGYSVRDVLSLLVYENALTPYILWDSLVGFIYKGNRDYPAYHNNSNLKIRLNFRYSWIFLLELVLTLVTCYKAINSGVQGYREYFLITWLLYTAFMNLATLVLYAEMPRYRRAERFISDKTCQVYCQQYSLLAKIADWNEIGARVNLVATGDYNVADILRDTPGKLAVDNQLLNFKVIWVSQSSLGIVFNEIDSDQYSYLIDNTYAQPIENVKPSRYQEVSRRDMRFEEMRPVIFKLSQLPERGQLLDISNSGCKLQARGDLQVEKERYILIQLNEHLWRAGTVRWVTKADDKTTLGIEFNEE